MPASFIQIPIELLKFVRQSKLTSLQSNLWLYFYELDPFGDRSVPIPSIGHIAAEFGVCTRSINTAIARLSDLGLMKFSYCGLSVQNTTTNRSTNKAKPRKKNVGNRESGVGSKGETNQNNTTPYSPLPTPFEVGKNFHKDDRNCKNEKKISLDGKNFHQQSSKYSQGGDRVRSQTNSDFKQTLSKESESKDFKFNNFSLQEDYWEDNSTYITVAENDLNLDLSSAEVELIDEKVEIKDRESAIAAEEKPWLIDRKYDANFVDWLAAKWSTKYGDSKYTAKANVLRHFSKSEENIAIAWSEYSAEYLDRYKNTAVRLANGLEIDKTEQKQLLDNHAAISRQMPEELHLVASLPQKNTKSLSLRASDSPSTSDFVRYPINNNHNQLLSQDSMFVSGVDRGSDGNDRSLDLSKIPNSEQKPNNIDAYKIWKPQPLEAPASPSQVKQLLQSFKNCFKSVPSSPQPEETNSELAKLNSWLSDDILYHEAVKRAKAAGYEIDYSPNGFALSISEPEF